MREPGLLKAPVLLVTLYSPECVEAPFPEVRQKFIADSSLFARVLVGWVYLLSSSCSLLELLVLSPWPTPSSHLYSPECVEGNSRNFAITEFYEVRIQGVLRSCAGAG
jgi:hypothetical protein